jgi:hypothetical protein
LDRPDFRCVQRLGRTDHLRSRLHNTRGEYGAALSLAGTAPTCPLPRQ